MPLTLATALLFCAAGAILILSAVQTKRDSRRRFKGRIETLIHPASSYAGAGHPGAAAGGQTGLDIRARKFAGKGLRGLWGVSAGASKLIAHASAWAVLSIILAFAVFRITPSIALPLGLCFGFFGARLVLIRQQASANKLFGELFPDTLDTIARMLRAGLPIATAIQTTGQDAPPPMNAIFSSIADQARIGVPVAEALDRKSAEIDSADFRFFAVAVMLHHSTGGNLISTIEILSGIVRKRRAVRRRAKAVTAEVRMSALILGSLPFITMGALLVIQPGYLSVLIDDSRGQHILGMAAGSLTLAALSIRQILRSVTKG